MATDTYKPQVASQEGALVGDENQPDPREVTVEVRNEDVPAQVASVREPDPSTVRVHETSVQLDEVITDPSSPEAVQVPDAGRGDLTLGAHRLSDPSPEAVFAEKASKPSKVSDKERAAADAEGRTAGKVE